MGKLTCQHCGAVAKADTRKDADDLIDHARGKMIGRPCSGLESDLRWTGANDSPRVEKVETDTEVKSPKKTNKKSKRG
jgi:hypothetical protein